MSATATTKGIGQPVRRKEDARLVVGAGCYSDDVDLPRQARAFVLRSVHAHARIRGIDTTRAKALRGVLARQIELISFSAEEKFKTLLGRSPHLLQIIPHKYLASYLGIDASTFSKLLGSVRL